MNSKKSPLEEVVHEEMHLEGKMQSSLQQLSQGLHMMDLQYIPVFTTYV